MRTSELALASRERLVEILTRAFVDDPAWVALGHPSRRRRERIMRLTFSGEVRRARRWGSHSRASLAGDGRAVGVAIAYPSAVWRKPHYSAVYELAALLGGPGAFMRGLQFNTAAERLHPSTPHVYLALLAVDPADQGVGIGSAILGEVIEASAGLPVYLETARADNVAFYEARGFQVQGEAALARDGRLWGLSRPPAPT
ncbi:MAG: GNAT family N-acetyltransferase [Solirubrobacteraceae bacterium]